MTFPDGRARLKPVGHTPRSPVNKRHPARIPRRARKLTGPSRAKEKNFSRAVGVGKQFRKAQIKHIDRKSK